VPRAKEIANVGGGSSCLNLSGIESDTRMPKE
jgi:hypothetical protein